MNIYVFVKRVPDTESTIRINHETNSIINEGLNFIINPYDEFAVEEALRIREAKGGKVTVVSVGSEETKVILKKCLAMGADEAVLIKDDTPEMYDGFRIAAIIAKAVESKFQDRSLLLFGKQAVGADNSQVPSMVAALLGMPQVNVITKLEIEGNSGVAHREIEGATEKISFALPAVVSAQKGLNEPRYETLKGIMMAKKKEIPVVSLQDLGLNEGGPASQLELVGMTSPPARQAGRVIEDEPEAAAKKLAEFLRQEAKVL
ncbi:MAG: electron transfer flavoprotein subunit beta/FixA family protein [Candidatus Aminicenantes bacterium]|nr:electron transfer flavoprotein subunit beta/FixA family protein [Candidatus Aminicenantes bacterium]